MKLKERFESACAARHLAQSTREIYWKRIFEFLAFHRSGDQWVNPDDMGGRDEIERWLTHLATARNFTESTQNQAFQAVLFLFKQVLQRDIVGVDALRARKPENIPVVLSQAEVFRLLDHLRGK